MGSLRIRKRKECPGCPRCQPGVDETGDNIMICTAADLELEWYPYVPEWCPVNEVSKVLEEVLYYGTES